MKIIVTTDKNWGIGKKGTALVNIPADQRMINSLTMDKTIILSRKAYESYAGKLSPQNRDFILLTQNKDYKAKNTTVVHSVEEALQELEGCSVDEVYVLGGESIFQQLLQYCDTVIVTRIDYVYEADSFFENLDEKEEWELVEESEEQTYFNLEYTRCTYCRKK